MALCWDRIGFSFTCQLSCPTPVSNICIPEWLLTTDPTARSRGVIKYYTEPPRHEEAQVSAALVCELAKEFDLDGIAQVEGSLMASLSEPRPSQLMAVSSMGEWGRGWGWKLCH